MLVNLFLVLIGVVLLICSFISAIMGLLKGQKMYSKETPSAIAQIIAQDVITSFVISPFFLYSIFLLSRGNVYGNIFVAGLSGYYLYTYASYSFHCFFNKLFLLNVTAFSSALFLFIIAAIELVNKINPINIPVTQLKLGGILLIIPGGLLLYLWLSQLIPATFKNKPVPIMELSGEKMTIQVKDLGVIAPALLGIGLLLVFSPEVSFVKAWLLILLLTGITMFAAVTAMAINETRAGYPDRSGIIIFSMFTTGYLSFFIWLLSGLNIS